jgi:hypothetical protein
MNAHPTTQPLWKPMQLILQSTTDYAAFRAAFDAEAENIANSGLNTLQIWRVVGGGSAALFEVANRAGAEAWLAKQSAFGRGYTATFVETA